MARPRKPVEQHLRDGTYRADRHGPIADEDLSPNPPVKPAGLSDAASAFWDYAVELLGGTVRDRDGPQLVEMCVWWAEIWKIRNVLAKESPGTMKYGRLMNAAKSASERFDVIAKRFGLTPADRAVLKAEQVISPKPKVATRPRFKLDRQGPPKR